jgi:glycosyltransferase involved in cell wall biosynthesis
VKLIPVSAIIPTLGRPERVVRTIASLLGQECVPAEIIVVDATTPPLAADRLPLPPAGVRIHLLPAVQRGAAVQRNQAVAAATQPFVLFADDDIDLEPGCLTTLWDTVQADPKLGACGAVITNQDYHPPGRAMRRAYALLGCPDTASLAGRCCGPALNFLPATSAPESQPSADWLNLCCTLVRRASLPEPPLLEFFHGYSLMEDAALTLEIAKRWRLAAPPAARVFHDVRPAAYKDRAFTREKMELINRWFVMRRIMGRDSFAWDLRMAAFQAGMLALSLRTAAGWRRLPAALAGKISGFASVLLHGHRWRGYTSPPLA